LRTEVEFERTRANEDLSTLTIDKTTTSCSITVATHDKIYVEKAVERDKCQTGYAKPQNSQSKGDQKELISIDESFRDES
jgi:hypothetical protein